MPEVSTQLWRQSSKYLLSYKIFLIVKDFYPRTICDSVSVGVGVGVYGNSQQGVPVEGGEALNTHGPYVV